MVMSRRRWPQKSWFLGLVLTCVPIQLSPGNAVEVGYSYTDPARFGGSWLLESFLEVNRSERECTCEEGPQAALWRRFRADLRANLAADPSMEGPWVHTLCGFAHPILFRLVEFDELGRLHVRSDCGAGLASMAAVCAQSLALQRQRQRPAWLETERVVQEEGRSVADYEGNIALAECFLLCDKNPDCMSFAHGAHGCHLKDRCVGPDDPLQSEADHAAGYRTHFRTTCQRGPRPTAALFASANDLRGGDQTSADRSPRDPASLMASPVEVEPQRDEEMLHLMDVMLQVLEPAAHCLDASSWPFSLRELLENHLEFTDDPGRFHWQRPDGAPSLLSAAAGTSRTARSADSAVSHHGAMLTATVAGDDGAIQRALDLVHVRWARHIGSEVGFWHGLLAPAAAAMERGEAAKVDIAHGDEVAKTRAWLSTGEAQWKYDDLCDYVASAQRAGATSRPSSKVAPPPRVLNAGSGPLAPPPLDCKELPGASARAAARSSSSVPVISADGLARLYLRTFDELGLQIPRAVQQCPVESLRRCFPANHFDVAHIRNALDHSADPLLGLRQMLEVTRPGGWVLLRHARNEGVPGEFRVGLHQWAFDVAGGGSSLRFIIWNPTLRADVTSWLLNSGLASEVRTELRPHPTTGSVDDEYVWVDIQKPVAA
eukprot:TRINITY_DN10969_c0_g1_i1.p1 TRINITY_DN10969_c0_g1~~TRINITY_DN10969_c0_g1_i1.p1  ORF type:complete len:659 (-),score=115.22 TRINITY_DN10969_c0_g1_i1:150-2126(-)